MSANFMPPLTPTEMRRHELLSDLAENVAQRLIEKHGALFAPVAARMQDDAEVAALISAFEEAAAEVGNALADFVADHWAGQNIHFPKDQAFKNSQRDWEIFRRFERGNANELARENGISKVRVHQIYRRCLAEYRARTQHGLFSEAQEPSTK